MAKSKYEYVKQFELDDRLLPGCFIVLRLDGRGFHRFVEQHNYAKPNDSRGLMLMNHCAKTVMNEFTDIVMAFGQSDEYSFLFRKDSKVFGRRAAKIISTIASLFASTFVFSWSDFFNSPPWVGDLVPFFSQKRHPGDSVQESLGSSSSSVVADQPISISLSGATVLNKPERVCNSDLVAKSVLLQYPPCFDARAVCYPNSSTVKDYFRWRQVDCHINCLYNTCFWLMVLSEEETASSAEKLLKDTFSKEKMNEILFQKYEINYNDLPPMYRRGSILIRQKVEKPFIDSRTGEISKKTKTSFEIFEKHDNLVPEEWWKASMPLI